MNRIIKNHNGLGLLGSTYCEPSRICQALRQGRQVAELSDLAVGLSGPPRNGGIVVIPTQPKKHNGALQDYFARSLSVSASIAWRPGWAQMDFVKDILKKSKIKVLHVCIDKANLITRFMSGAS